METISLISTLQCCILNSSMLHRCLWCCISMNTLVSNCTAWLALSHYVCYYYYLLHQPLFCTDSSLRMEPGREKGGGGGTSDFCDSKDRINYTFYETTKRVKKKMENYSGVSQIR